MTRETNLCCNFRLQIFPFYSISISLTSLNRFNFSFLINSGSAQDSFIISFSNFSKNVNYLRNFHLKRATKTVNWKQLIYRRFMSEHPSGLSFQRIFLEVSMSKKQCRACRKIQSIKRNTISLRHHLNIKGKLFYKNSKNCFLLKLVTKWFSFCSRN